MRSPRIEAALRSHRQKGHLRAAFPSGYQNSPAWPKDTGLIFVSNEKTNNLIVIDPKSYQIVKDIKVARRPCDIGLARPAANFNTSGDVGAGT